MTRNTATTSSTAANKPNRIINEIAPREEHRRAAENIIDRIENTNYTQNNPVKSALAALVIAGEDKIEPIVTPEHLTKYNVQTDALRDAELRLRESSGNEITTSDPPENTHSRTSTYDRNTGKIDRVHSHIERIGVALEARHTTISTAHEFARVTQPRDHNAELIAGAAVYLAGHYTDDDHFSQAELGDVMDGSTGNIGQISAHLAGFDYCSRKCVVDTERVESLPIITYITDYCDQLGVRDAVQEFTVDLIVEFEVLDGRWHLPQNVGIPAIDTALEIMGTASEQPISEVYPRLPTEQAIEKRKEEYLDEIGYQRATRECAKHAVTDITNSEDITVTAQNHIDNEMSDVMVTDMTALEVAEHAFDAAVEQQPK